MELLYRSRPPRHLGPVGTGPVSQKSKAVLDFKGIPLEQVNRLTEVLTGELPPVPKVPLLEKLLPQA